MLAVIRNRLNLPSIERLNQKIEQYNEARQNNSDDQKLLLHLLQEINFLHQSIKNELIALPGENYFLKPQASLDVQGFEGIGKELEGFGLIASEGTLAEEQLAQVLSQPLTQRRLSVWDPFSPLFKLNEKLEGLNKQKNSLRVDPPVQLVKQHLSQLQALKEELMQQLAFSSKNEKEIRYLRQALEQINSEITIFKEKLPALAKTEQQNQKVRDSTIYQSLIHSDPEALIDLFNHLISPPDPQALAQRFPGWEFKRLGGKNNYNWLITNKEQDLQLVLQAIPSMALSTNHELLRILGQTPEHDYLGANYFATADLELQGQLVLTEYCAGGDLLSVAQKEPSKEDKEKIKQATNTLTQLTSICQNLLKAQVMHSDIKLSNFLINEAHEIRIVDKKALRTIDSQGNIATTLDHTEDYAPPEYLADLHVTHKAESYMCYQLGMAFYEHLIAPEELPKERDFKQSVFVSSPETTKLIKSMIDPDPEKRPSLHEVNVQLKQLASPLVPAPHQIQTQYQYHTNSTNESRFHIKKVSGSDFNVTAKYKSLVGDVLKSKILDEFKTQIANTSSKEELKELQNTIQGTEEYKILAKSQGIATSILQNFGKNTTSIDTLNKMFAEQEHFLENKPSARLD